MRTQFFFISGRSTQVWKRMCTQNNNFLAQKRTGLLENGNTWTYKMQHAGNDQRFKRSHHAWWRRDKLEGSDARDQIRWTECRLMQVKKVRNFKGVPVFCRLSRNIAIHQILEKRKTILDQKTDLIFTGTKDAPHTNCRTAVYTDCLIWCSYPWRPSIKNIWRETFSGQQSLNTKETFESLDFYLNCNHISSSHAMGLIYLK